MDQVNGYHYACFDRRLPGTRATLFDPYQIGSFNALIQCMLLPYMSPEGGKTRKMDMSSILRREQDQALCNPFNFGVTVVASIGRSSPFPVEVKL